MLYFTIYINHLCFSFLKCLKDAATNNVGCFPDWLGENTTQSTCYTLDQLEQVELFYTALFTSEQKQIIKLTGCLPPCKFTEYNLEKEYIYKNNVTTFRYLGFGFYFATTDLAIKEDKLVYPPTSFLAEFGGALGLFLGFSFFSAGDIFIWIFKALKFLKR